MSFSLLGIGTALPNHLIEQQEAAAIAATLCDEAVQQQEFIRHVYERAGVKTRHSVLLQSPGNVQPVRQSFYSTASPAGNGPTTGERMAHYELEAAPLAIAAAHQALQRAQLAPHEVTHLITVSCTGFVAPGIDRALIDQLSLPLSTSRTHIGFMGCHAAINALRVAQAYADADRRACVLLCAVELCTLHHQYSGRPDLIVANALFADGAAAVVGRRGSVGRSALGCVTATGSHVLPGTQEMMSWRIGNHGFLMTLSIEVPDLIRRHLGPWLSSWLSNYDLSIDSVGTWAIHPGGPKILQACAEAIGLADEQLVASQTVLSELGNMSSPTILFILDRLAAQSAPRPCVALGFGPGLAIEAALIE